MNVFVLSENPQECAKLHCDKHVVKMIVESAQLLSTAHHVLGSGTNEMYRPAYRNHPCAKWVRESKQNYEYLYNLFIALIDEWHFRYHSNDGKVHACERLVKLLKIAPRNIENSVLTPHPLCMPDQYKESDPVKSYHNYYREEKSRFAKWTKRSVPMWMKKEQA